MFVSKLAAFAAVLAAVGATAAARQSPVPPDLLLVNGHVLTVDFVRSTRPRRSPATGERITAVGASASLRRLAGPATRIIDSGREGR